MITGEAEPTLIGTALQRAYADKFSPEEASNRAALVEIGIDIATASRLDLRGERGLPIVWTKRASTPRLLAGSLVNRSFANGG